MNTGSAGIVTSLSIPAATYTFVMTATAQNQTGTAQSTFNIAGGGVPSFIQPVEGGKAVMEEAEATPALQRRLQEIMVNEDLESMKNQ